MANDRLPLPALVINDGTLSGLVAAWTAGTVRTSDHSEPRSVAWMPTDSLPARERRHTMVARQVPICGLASMVEHEYIALTPGPDDPAESLAGPSTTAMLLTAAIHARRAGLSRVIWPIHSGPDADLDLDRLAGICDRALLVSQLIALDEPRVATTLSDPIRIETPYADFTDAELMELALDLDAPISACWWCYKDDTESPCGSCPECTRWRDALTAVDPQGLLDPTSLWGAPQTA